MSFNISEFSSKLNKYGLSRDNLFLVNITPPDLGVDMPAQDLRFFCNSVSLPALSITTADVQTQGYGLAEKRPTGLPLDNLNTVFMVDSTYRVKEFFHRWAQSIVNYDNNNGYNYEYNRMLPYETAYKDSYVGTIQIFVYSYNERDIKYVYEFGHAYPVALGEITTSWENNDNVMVMPVQFAYDQYKVDGLGQSVKSSRINSSRGFGGGGVGGFITSLGNFGQALDSIGINTPIQDIVNKYSSVASRINSGLEAVRGIF